MFRSLKINRLRVATAILGMGMVGSVVAQSLPNVRVWKDPNCGCCKEWITHMQRAGFSVTTMDVGNASARARLGMPADKGSCHTAQVGQYVIEGHVPAADVKRLLKEKPQAVGLAAPGMPIGSPGMDSPVYGGRAQAYDVLLVRKDGSSSVFQAHPGR